MAEADETLACYRNQLRECGPDCMAYLPQVPEGVHYQGASWAHCHQLVCADRTARHLVVLTEVLKENTSLQRRAAAEAARTQKAPVAQCK
jgi:hypothetical protein